MGLLDAAFDGFDFTDRLKETLQDVGWVFAGPAVAAYDMARAALPGGPSPGDKQAGVIPSLLKGLGNTTQILFGDENDSANPEDDEPNLFSGAVGKAVDALEYVYDQGITPAASFPLVLGQRIMADVKGVEDNKSRLDFFGGPNSIWGEADDNRSSIGREAAYFWHGLFGDDRGLTDEGQKVLDSNNKVFDVISGANDAGSRWFLDPTIVGGKVAKGVTYTRAISRIKSPLDVAAKIENTRAGILPAFGARHENFMGFVMSPASNDATRSAAEIRAAVPGLRENADGWVISRALENTMRTLRKQGVDEDDIHDDLELIVLAGYGDADALASLSDNAIAAKDMIAAASSKYDDLMDAATWARVSGARNAPAPRYGTQINPSETVQGAAERFNVVEEVRKRGIPYFRSPEFMRRTTERLKAAEADIRAAEREYARRERLSSLMAGTEDEAGLVGTLANRPLLAGTLVGSTRALEKRAKRERGEKVGMDFVFQSSLWNKGIRLTPAVPVVPPLKWLAPHVQLGYKLSSTFRQTHAPSVIEVHDPNAPKALNDFLKATPLATKSRELLVTRMADARDEHTMRAVVSTAIVEGQKAFIDDFATRHPLSFSGEGAQIIKDAIQKMADEDRARGMLQARQFTAHKTNGVRGDLVQDDDGLMRYQALLETQLENYFPLPNLRNIEHVLNRHANYITDMVSWVKGERAPDPGRISEIAEKTFGVVAKKRPGLEKRTARRLDMLNNAPWRTEELIYQGLEMFNRIWKFLVLGTRPIPYSMRVQTDSGLRAMAVLGPTSYIAKSTPRALGFLTLGGATRAKQKFLYMRAHRADEELTAEVQRFEDAWRAANDTPVEDAPEYLNLVGQRDGIRAQIKQYEIGTRQSRREAFGRFGEVGLKDIRTAAGTIPGAFGDDFGRAQRRFIESKTSAGIMGDAERTTYSDLSSGSWTYLEYSAPNHMPAWLHAINAQLKQSEIGKKAMEFQARRGDDAEAAIVDLARWMRTSPEGKMLQKRLMWTMANKELHAREVVGYVNHYLPTPELRRAALQEKRLTRQQLEAALPNPEDRPPVHGEALAGAMGRGSSFSESANRMMSRYMSFISDAAEDQLSRHPLYAAVYQAEAKRRAEFLMADPRLEALTGGDLKRLVQDQAHKEARSAVKKYMFDIASHSDLSHFLRFMSPFIAAWEDTVRKWGRIVRERPEIIGRAYLLWNAPNDMGMVVDGEGKPVDKDTPWDETYVVMQWPEWVPAVGGKQIIPVPNAHFRLPKQVVNIVLQGGLQPGFGPVVAYPAGKLQVWQPQLNDVAKIINPYGPPKSAWDAVAPSTFKRVQELVDEQSIPHRQLFAVQYQKLVFEARKDPARYAGVNLELEAQKRTKWLGVLKIMNNFGNPFPVVVDSPYKFYQDAYNVLQAQEADPNLHLPVGYADEQFMQRYGESYMILVTGLSRNNAGLRPSEEAVDAAKRLDPLIAKYAMENGKAVPSISRLIVGEEGQGQFNQSAHRWQLTHEMSPGSGINYRDYDNPQAAVAEQDIDLGWYKYRKFTSTIDGLANSQGLRTFRDNPELVEKRRQFIENLGKENSAWFVDYSQKDPTKFQRRLNQLASAAESDLFSPLRTDMVGVRQYAAMRREIQARMAAGGVKENTNAAYPYKAEFTDAVMDLVSQNTKFAEWSFYQFLDRDPLLLTPEDHPPVATGFNPAAWGI